MIVHKVKTLPDYFEKSWSNKKSFELRKDDRALTCVYEWVEETKKD